jgi:hypothetical protein
VSVCLWLGLLFDGGWGVFFVFGSSGGLWWVFLIGFCSSCVVILVVEAFYYNFVIIYNNFVIFVFLCLK